MEKSGPVQDERVECPTCGGTGAMYYHPSALVAMNCWECKGSGTVVR